MAFKGMKWGVRKDRNGPTPKADAVRAVIGGGVLAPASTGRTAGRVVNAVNKEAGSKAPQTKAQQAKTVQRQKQGEKVTKTLLRR